MIRLRAKAVKIAILLIFLSLIPLAALASAAEEGHGSEGVNIKTEISRIINFAIIVTALYFLLRKPLGGYLSLRRENLRKALDEARKARETAEQRMGQMEERLRSLDQETERMKREAEEERGRLRGRILREAEEGARKIKEDAILSIEQELLLAKKGLHDEAAQLAVELAEGIIKKHLTREDQDRMVDHFLDSVDET